MKLKKTLIATAVAGVLGAGAYAALPAGASSQSAVELQATPAAAVSTATPAAPTTPVCHLEEWPDEATGQPAGLKAGATKGFYLWHNAEGWHLEVTHPSDDHMVFSGYITTNGTLAAQRVDDERNDFVTVGPDHHTVSFVFNNYGGIDGVHFETHCATTLVVHLRINGHEVAPEQVFIGHGSVNPLSVPFTIERDGVH